MSRYLAFVIMVLAVLFALAMLLVWAMDNASAQDFRPVPTAKGYRIYEVTDTAMRSTEPLFDSRTDCDIALPWRRPPDGIRLVCLPVIRNERRGT